MSEVQPSAGPKSPTMPAPGWYQDPNGETRWWSGAEWGQLAAQTYGYGYAVQAPAQPNVTLAWLSHLGFLAGGFILPLVLYLTTGKTDPYVRHHSAEALNFQLTYLVVALGGGMAVIVVAILFLAAVPAVGIALMIIGGVVYVAALVLQWVWGIMACVKANRGEWWRYPINIRFVKGAMPASTPPLTVA